MYLKLNFQRVRNVLYKKSIYAIAIVDLELKLQHISDDKTSLPERKESIIFFILEGLINLSCIEQNTMSACTRFNCFSS